MGIDRSKPLTHRGIMSETRPGRYKDILNDFGLEIRIRALKGGDVSKRFYQRRRINGDDAEIPFGPFPAVSLDDARHKALKNQVIIEEGGDPREDKKPVPEPVLDTVQQVKTVLEALEYFIPMQNLSPRKIADWRGQFRNYVAPFIGNKGIDTVTRADVIQLLVPIWPSHKAGEIRNRLSKLFLWAVAMGYRADNAADDAAVVALRRDRIVSTPFAAVAYQDTEDYIAEMRTLTSHDLSMRLGMEFKILTGSRHRPVFEAEWSEINLTYEVFTPKDKSLPPLQYPCWVVPKDKTKTREEDIMIPLSQQALEVLAKALILRKRHPRYIFPTALGNASSPSATKGLRDDTSFEGTGHGFRATLTTWGQDYYVPEEICELAMGHKIKGDRSKYARSVLLAHRVYMLQDYSNYHISNLPKTYTWTNRFVPGDPSSYPEIPTLPRHDFEALTEASESASNPEFTLLEDVQTAVRTVQASDEDTTTKQAFMFMSLNVALPARTCKAQRSDIDMTSGIWGIPAKQPLSIPLSKAALRIVEHSQTDDSESLFPDKKGKPIKSTALAALCKKLNLPTSPPLIQTAFRIWCEESGVPDDLVRDALGRKRPEPLVPIEQPDTTEDRRRLMQKWSEFLLGEGGLDERLFAHHVSNERSAEPRLNLELVSSIRTKRAESLMTRKDLAEHLGVSSATIASWERGTVPSNKSHGRIDKWLAEPISDWVRILTADGLIGQRVKTHRIACGMTQADLAEHLGVSTAVVGSWERGNSMPTMQKGRQLANWLTEPASAGRAKTSINTDLGERIQAKRMMLGISQSELGKRLGIDKKSIREWEYGWRAPSKTYAQTLIEWLNESDDVLLCDRIREMRHRVGMTQRELAARLGCNLDAIKAWEQNRKGPTPEQFGRIMRWMQGAQISLSRRGVDYGKELEYRFFVQPMKERRIQLGKTAVDVSSELGASHAVVSRWETRDRTPNLDSCKRIFAWLQGDTAHSKNL